MAVHPDKDAVLRAELGRLVRQLGAGVTQVDLTARRTPGPVTDDEWEEWVASLGRLEDRAYTMQARNSRRLTMTRRGQ